MFAQILVTCFAVGVLCLFAGMIVLCILNRNATTSGLSSKQRIPHLIRKASQESVFLNRQTEQALLDLIVALQDKAKQESKQTIPTAGEDQR